MRRDSRSCSSSGCRSAIFAPGTTPAYSNYGASLAGLYRAAACRASRSTTTSRSIFSSRSTCSTRPSASRCRRIWQPLMSKGYVLASEPPNPFEIVGPAPAGALSSPGEDMAHFMIAHLQNGEYHGNRILSAETAEMMHNSPLTLLPPLNRMELGFFETNINGREVIGHLGDTDYLSHIASFVPQGRGRASTFPSTACGKNGAADSLRTALFDDFADRYFPAEGGTAGGAASMQRPRQRMRPCWWDTGSIRAARQSNFLAAVGLIGQTKVSLDAKGELVVPFKGLNEKPRQLGRGRAVSLAGSDGHERLAAKVVDGQSRALQHRRVIAIHGVRSCALVSGRRLAVAAPIREPVGALRAHGGGYGRWLRSCVATTGRGWLSSRRAPRLSS